MIRGDSLREGKNEKVTLNKMQIKKEYLQRGKQYMLSVQMSMALTD